MTGVLLEDLAAELAAIRECGLGRSLRCVTGPLGPTVLLDGREVVQFCSNDYLGLAGHPSVAAAVRRCLDEEGVGAGAARLVVGNHQEHVRLEAAIAEWKGTEAALLFGAGFLANVGVPAALTGPEDLLLSDQLNHASLIDGARLARARVAIYPHRDVAALATLIQQPARRRVILTESLFSMDGDIAPRAALRALAEDHDALLVVDEAHAIGAVGDGGRGLWSATDAHLHIGTFGKALGSYGAYVAGSRLLIDLLLHRARSFVFNTALPPLIAAAAAAGLAIVSSAEGDRLRALLAARCAQLHSGLDALGLPSRPATHIVALHVGDPGRAMALTGRLLDRGLYVQGIRPPTVPDGTARLRLSLSAAHTTTQVDLLLEALGDARDVLKP